MIADDHRARSQDRFRIAVDFNIDIEDCSQEKGEGIAARGKSRSNNFFSTNLSIFT